MQSRAISFHLKNKRNAGAVIVVTNNNSNSSPMSNKSTADNLLSSQKVDDISENSEEDGNTIKKSVKFQPKPNSAGPGQLQTKLKSILFGFC